MVVIVGLVLLGLTVYVSALAYTLPVHSRARLEEELRAESAERWLKWLDRYVSELHTAVGLVRIALSMCVLAAVWVWLTAELGYAQTAWTGLVAGLITLLVLAFFAVAVPHALALHAAEPILATSLGVLAALRWAFWPLGRLFNAVEFIVRRLLGKAEATAEADTERVAQEILDAVWEGEAQGAVDEKKKEMIESVFALDETTVSAIMTPRTDIDALPADASYDDVRGVILRTGHSRIPVYEGSIDHIIGVLYAKDLLRLGPGEPFDARKTMRAAPYVPGTKTLNELLSEFRATKVQIAIVLDEYGGTAGLATIEDILEELVGEIADEYDQKAPPTMNRIAEDTLEVDARVHISEINAALEIELPEEEDYETIGGFVFATLGKIPAAGEELEHGDIRVRVVEVEPRRIRRLRIHVIRERATST